MARRCSVLSPDVPIHIGARAINREWFDLPMEEVWALMEDQLHFLTHAFGVRVLAFVLMNNHFHLLALAPRGNLSEGMAFFMRETSRALARASRRINSTYGGRFFRSQLGSAHHYLNACKYLYRNPVQAGLCARVEDYRWSTLRGLLGFEKLVVPVWEDQTLFADVEGTLAWLNRESAVADWRAIGSALRRKTFSLGKDRISPRPNRLEFNLL